MREILFRCSSIGKLMTEPRSKSEGPLSKGAKTYIRNLAAQEIFGVDFVVSSKEMEKGIRCEDASIALLNQVRGLSLTKNTERRTDEFLTGEADLFDASRRRGHDIKTSWSIASFPIVTEDCHDDLYEYQMRGYMRLYDADEWSVDYCLVDTPDDLIRYEPIQLHVVGHIDPHHRVTSWVIKRDLEIEARMVEKVRHARDYFMRVVDEFSRTHADPAEIQAMAAAGLPAPWESPSINEVKPVSRPAAPAATPALLDF